MSTSPSASLLGVQLGSLLAIPMVKTSMSGIYPYSWGHIATYQWNYTLNPSLEDDSALQWAVCFGVFLSISMLKGYEEGLEKL